MQNLITDKILLQIDGYDSKSGHKVSEIISAGEWVYINTLYANEIINGIRQTKKEDNLNITSIKVHPHRKSDLDVSQIRRSFGVIEIESKYPQDSTVQEILDVHCKIVNTLNSNRSSLNSQLESFNISPSDRINELSVRDRITFELLKLLSSDLKMIVINQSFDLLEKDRRYELLSILYNKTVIDGLSVMIATNDLNIQTKYLGRNI